MSKRAPGVAAKTNGTKLKRGKSVRFMCYPRPASKAVLVKAARLLDVPVSNFLVLSALQRSARLLGKPLKSLLPQQEYEKLTRTASAK